MSRPFAWSYSALTRYETCPKQYYEINVAKTTKDSFGSEDGNEGDKIHKALFRRVAKGDPLSIEYRHFEPLAKKFADTRGEKRGELKLALNRQFEPTDFFANDVYIRAIVDLLILRDDTAIVVDWKTGKIKDDFTQLAMAAAVVSQYMPEIEHFKVAFVWLKHKNISPRTYTKHELKGVWAGLLPRASRIELALKTTDFPAKQSGLCGWCPVHSCPHYSPRGGT